MIKNIIAIVFLCLSGAAQAQTGKLDSLKGELQKVPIDQDSTHMTRRAALLIYMAYEFTNAYENATNYTQSRECARQALFLYQQLKIDRGIVAAYRSISFSYGAQGNFVEAIDTGILALNTFERMQDTVHMIRAASDLAQDYDKMGNATDKAVKYAKLCMEWSRQAGRKYGLCACQALLGGIYSNATLIDSAEYHNRAALALAEQIGDKYVLPSLFLGMGEVNRLRKHYDTEREWLLKVKKAYEEEKAFDIPEFKFNLWGRLFHNALNRNDFKAARQYQRLAVPLLPFSSDLDTKRNYYEDLSHLAEHDGNYADALRHFKTYVTLKDSIIDLEKTRRVTQIQMTYDFERKQAAQTAAQERELALRDARNQQQRLIFGFVTLALLGGAVFWFYAYRQKQERRRSELELANLRAQINPHFIFNCLNSIYRYTKERDTETASKYLHKFSSLLRSVLENSRSEKITLARDLEALQLYADIEGLRFKEKLHFSIEMDPDIDPTFVEIPGMLIQPHVENAIWHGLMHRPAGGEIVVRLRQPQENLLRVEIEDNGIGRATAAELASKSATQQKSLGQKITAERLKATGKLANTETIDLYDSEGKAAGTRIVLDIPL